MAWVTAVAIPAGITYVVVKCMDDCKNEQNKSCGPEQSSNGMKKANECAQRCIPFLKFLGLNSVKSIATTTGKKAGEAVGSN